MRKIEDWYFDHVPRWLETVLLIAALWIALGVTIGYD